jgi:hypothetical protein
MAFDFELIQIIDFFFSASFPRITSCFTAGKRTGGLKLIRDFTPTASLCRLCVGHTRTLTNEVN